jgi:tRNA threonylcarbamoyladenosine biosynthesis protein TsaE
MNKVAPIATEELLLPNEQSTLDLGGKLAQQCITPAVIFLYGELGAGKTTLVRGFLRAMGYTDKVKSPSYNLVEYYDIQGKSILHFDFYRIRDPHELDFMGIQDFWQSSSIFIVEWPEKVAHLLPPVNLVCYLQLREEGRNVKIEYY